MKKIFDFLKEWAVNYAKNKDIFAKTITDIEEREREITVRHKHKEQKFFIDPFLEHFKNDLKSLKEDSHVSIICLNTRENFNSLIDNWDYFVFYSHLSVIFVNPLLSVENVWVIFPYTHSRIADEEPLKLGLQTMCEQVEAVDRKRAEEMF